MAYILPSLPFSLDGLEPFYDKATLEIHHGKHHAGYVTKLNDALIKHAGLAALSVEELLADLRSVPTEVKEAVIQNGGGHANHSLFWRTLEPQKSSAPSGALVEAITGAFGSINDSKEMFSNLTANVFGSGWTWLFVDKSGKLVLLNTQNQDSPLSIAGKPILTLDLWEHAYYLKFQNRRSEWVDSWWNVVNWTEVSSMYQRIVSGASLPEIYAETKPLLPSL